MHRYLYRVGALPTHKQHCQRLSNQRTNGSNETTSVPHCYYVHRETTTMAGANAETAVAERNKAKTTFMMCVVVWCGFVWGWQATRRAVVAVGCTTGVSFGFTYCYRRLYGGIPTGYVEAPGSPSIPAGVTSIRFFAYGIYPSKLAASFLVPLPTYFGRHPTLCDLIRIEQLRV
jgi:hypothetical protein